MMKQSKATGRIASFFLCAVMLLTCFTDLYGLTAASADSSPVKAMASYFTEEIREIIKENIENHSWAQATASSFSASADNLLKNGFDAIWSLVPSQGMPRSAEVRKCPYCGSLNGMGSGITSDPWKVACKDCSRKFPSNDFESYYKSSLDENGRFVYGAGDNKYLKNVLYPEKGEGWGVDDGYGYKDKEGYIYTFAAYSAYIYWVRALSNIDILYKAYLYTGEQKYADLGIILLDRVADLYPELNIKEMTVARGFYHSHGGGGQGKIAGSISECDFVPHFLYAYDALFPAFPTMSGDAVKYLSDKSGGKKKTYKDVMVNIEDGFVKQIFPAVKCGQIRGNSGMHQFALALAAVVIDDAKLSKEWLDFVFKSGVTTVTKITGGNLSSVFVNDIDRDGNGNEAAPAYNQVWLSKYIEIANLLKGYVINGTELSYDIYENVKFKKMFYSMAQIITANIYTPKIGDFEQTGNPKILASLSHLIDGYLVYKDPYLARAAYFVNHNTSSGIRLDITDKDPEAIAEEIEKVVKEYGEFRMESNNLTGYGLAILQNEAVREEEVREYPGSCKYLPDDIEILNEKSVSPEELGAARTGDGIALKDKASTLLFYLDNEEAVYDVIINVRRGGSSGVYNVFLDGKLAQAKLELSGKESLGEKAYMRKTFRLSHGLHMISFDPVSEDASATITALNLIKSNTQINDGNTKPANTTSLAIYYGRNGGHGHNDNLNLFLYSFGIDLTPDLGNPEHKDAYDMMRKYFVENVISHNTVMVNKAQQVETVIASEPLHYDENDWIKLIDVDGSQAYTMASEYRRTSVLVKYSDDHSYVVDFFRVAGGYDHIYSFHSAESDGYKTEGLELVPQTNASGEYIGTLLSKGTAWGEKNDPTGFQYFTKVRKASNDINGFSVDWSIVDTYGVSSFDKVHMKMHMLGEYDGVTLSVGTPPRNKTGNPSELEYVFVENKSEKNGLESLFTSVIEPYDIAGSYIVSSELCPVTKNGAEADGKKIRAVKTVLADGRTDYIVFNSGKQDDEYLIDGKFTFKGYFAAISEKDGKLYKYVNDASLLCGDTFSDRIGGTLSSFTKELTDKNYLNVKLDTDTDVSSLAGRYVYIENDLLKNTVYRIVSAAKKDSGYELYIGDATLIGSYKDSTNSSFVYDVKEGAKLYIPLSKVSGDGSVVESGTETKLFSQISVSNGVKNGAKAGDFVAKIICVPNDAKSASQIPEYTVSIDEGSSNKELFEIRENCVYLKQDSANVSSKSYELVLAISSGSNVEHHKVFITSLSASASADALYPDLPLTYIPVIDPEDPGNDPGSGEEQSKNPDKTVLFVIIGIAVVCIAAAAILIALKKKKKA